MSDPLNLKGFSLAALDEDATGQPLALPVKAIDYNPDNIRNNLNAETLAQLAESIKSQGLIQPISVRRHPTKPDRYIVNAGERRLRAVRSLGHDSIDAYIRDQYDPYLVAAENVHRDDWSAMELSQFIAKREAEGHTRAEIARRLKKPATFITEIAALANAPAAIIKAYDNGRVTDARAIYLLTKAHEAHPDAVRGLLRGDSPLTRASVESALAAPFLHAETAATEKKRGRGKTVKGGKPWDALAVQVKGRKGYLALRAGAARERADVVFEDGSSATVALSGIKLLAWTRMK